MNDLYAYVGKAIRDTRLDRKLTQSTLASAIGLTRTSISNIEKGRQKLLLHTFSEIASVLGVDPARLLPPRETTGKNQPAEALPSDLEPRARAFIETAIGIRKRR